MGFHQRPPPAATKPCPNGELLRYRVPFVAMDRMQVSLGLRGEEDDECLLTLHGLRSTPPLMVVTSPHATTVAPSLAPSFAPEAAEAAEGEPKQSSLSSYTGGSQHPLSMTPQPMSSFEHRGRNKGHVNVQSQPLPLVFRISKADGEIWAKVIEE